MDNGSVLVVKTHRQTTRRHFSKAVLLIRDPVDAFIAEKNRQYGGHTGMAPESEYSDRGEFDSVRQFRCSLDDE